MRLRKEAGRTPLCATARKRECSSGRLGGGGERKDGSGWGVEEIWEQLEQQVRGGGGLLSCTASIIQADSAELPRAAASQSPWAEAAV